MEKIIISFSKGVQGVNNHLTLKIEGSQSELKQERTELKNFTCKNGNVITCFHLKEFKDGEMTLRMWDADQQIFDSLIERGYSLGTK